VVPRELHELVEAGSIVGAVIISAEVTTTDTLQIVYGEPGKAKGINTSLYEPRQQVTSKDM